MNTNPELKEENPMKKRIMLFVRKALIDQRGQMIPWVALGMVAFLGVAGLSIDVGHAYVVRGQLQNTANASALAAAGLVYTSQSQSVNTTTQADQYSAGSGDENANPALGTVTTTVTSKCLNMLMPTGETCGSGSPPTPSRSRTAPP